MEVLFVILKIIGILLAILLLFCIALILVPVRYRVNIKVQDEVEGKAVIHWLFHLVDVRISYKGKTISYRVRLFGFPLMPGRGREKGQGSPGRIKKKKKEKNISEKPAEFETAGQEELNSQGKSFLEKEASAEKEKIQKERMAGEEKEASPKTEQKKRIGNRHFWNRIKTRFYNLRRRFRTMARDFVQRMEDIKNGTATLKEQMENIKSMISEETNQEAFFHILREARYLLRHYAPGTISGNVTFSMGNPEQTGKALGAMSLLPFWARSRMVIMPDFLSESFYRKGILFVTGHIRFLHMLILGIRLIADKNIRKLITNIRK